MAEDGQVIRGINWRQTFPFTNIFRSFRIAIHLSKLILGLALFLTVYFGGSLLDSVWPVHERGILGEVDQYEKITLFQIPGPFSAWREQQQRDMDDQYAALLTQYGVEKTDANTTPDVAHQQLVDDAHNRRHSADIEAVILKQRDDDVKQINDNYTKLLDSIDHPGANPLGGAAETPSQSDKDSAKADAKRDYQQTLADTYDKARVEYENVETFLGTGLFESFYRYEVRQFTGVAKGAVSNNWLPPGGVLDCCYNFFAVGPVWLVWEHSVFAVLFLIIFLFAWSIFGGAIARIAAVHVARDEKISVRQAMNFSVGKFLSYASAPIIPLVIVMVIGLLVTLVALVLGNIPGVGPIVVGGLFILALLAGFVITLVLLGTAGGFNLMYPTIAVEGSDSFDAISRSFSYVYARPWRMTFYTVVAITYGAVTYLFVHLFIWMMLVITHHFVGMGMFGSADNGRDLLTVMWPSPNSVGRLTYAVDHLALGHGQLVGAYLIKCWVMLLVSFLGAFAISLYFSTNTVIYFLMRSEVDATEMDDVYVAQADDELDPVTSDATRTEVTVTTTTVTTEPASTDQPPMDQSPGASSPEAPPA